MQIEHLQYLLAAVEHGSINKAAEALYVSQPAISAGIKSLEADLGYPLLERTSKGVIPTEFGRYVIEDAKLILSYYNSWPELADKLSISHPITIVFTGTAPRYNIVEAIVKTQEKNPDIKTHVQFQHEPDAALSHVNSRIGIQYKIPAHVKDARDYASSHGLRLALLQQDEFAIFASADNPIFQNDQIYLEDLRGKRVLLFQNPERFPYIEQLRSVNVNISAQMYHEDNLMVAIALMKDAIAIRPSKTGQNNPYIDSGNIKVAPIIDCPMPVNLYVSYPNERRIYKSEQIFIDSLAESFPLFEVVKK